MNHRFSYGSGDPVASTTPSGLPAWGPRSASGSDTGVAGLFVQSQVSPLFDFVTTHGIKNVIRIQTQLFELLSSWTRQDNLNQSSVL
jgi:hypothetical protein